MHENSARGRAALAHVYPDADVRSHNGLVEVCVFVHDQGRLSTKLQRDLLQVALSCHLDNLLAHGRAAGKGYLRNAWMTSDQGPSWISRSVYDVDDTRREACLPDK